LSACNCNAVSGVRSSCAASAMNFRSPSIDCSSRPIIVLIDRMNGRISVGTPEVDSCSKCDMSMACTCLPSRVRRRSARRTTSSTATHTSGTSTIIGHSVFSERASARSWRTRERCAT
jgi:hypothetical protein